MYEENYLDKIASLKEAVKGATGGTKGGMPHVEVMPGKNEVRGMAAGTLATIAENAKKNNHLRNALIAGGTAAAVGGGAYAYNKNKKNKEEKVAYYKEEIFEKVAEESEKRKGKGLAFGAVGMGADHANKKFKGLSQEQKNKLKDKGHLVARDLVNTGISAAIGVGAYDYAKKNGPTKTMKAGLAAGTGYALYRSVNNPTNKERAEKRKEDRAGRDFGKSAATIPTFNAKYKEVAERLALGEGKAGLTGKQKAVLAASGLAIGAGVGGAGAYAYNKKQKEDEKVAYYTENFIEKISAPATFTTTGRQVADTLLLGSKTGMSAKKKALIAGGLAVGVGATGAGAYAYNKKKKEQADMNREEKVASLVDELLESVY